MRAPLRGERPAMARTRRAGRMAAELLERRSDGAQSASGACAKRGGMGCRARTRVADKGAGGRLHRTSRMTPVVKTQKAAGAVRHRPLFLSRAPISSA